MNRKEFIAACGYTCLAFAGITLADSCTTVKYVEAGVEQNRLKVARCEFEKSANKKGNLRHYIIVRSTAVHFPIVLYRFSESDYSAMLLQCTHQGAELTVSGDLISCPAHGSEFTNRGAVVQGPAASSLKQYRVTTDNEHIFIHLS